MATPLLDRANRGRWPIEFVDHRVDEVLQLARLFQASQVPDVYSREEMDALTNAEAESSWAPKGLLRGPSAFVARSEDGRVIAGVEIWQQKRDRFCYLDLLVRDQAREYRGVGKNVAVEAIGWLMRQTEEGPYGVRVHTMAREERLVEWWSDEVLHMPPNIHDAFVRTADHSFPVVGWIIRATPQT